MAGRPKRHLQAPLFGRTTKLSHTPTAHTTHQITPTKAGVKQIYRGRGYYPYPQVQRNQALPPTTNVMTQTKTHTGTGLPSGIQ